MSRSLPPRDLPAALDHADPATTVLSLDCFDTLIWRSTHAPVDVFSDLKAAGVTASARRTAEVAARLHARQAGRDEVTLAEIYARLAPLAGEAERRGWMEAELRAEALHCFAFGPTVELIRRARARGLRVVVVSDTYLDEPQLRALIATAAGPDVLAMIERVFCSSAYGRPKAGGLFHDVLRELDVPAAQILHLGDNRVADLEAAERLGLQALHLRQFSPETERRLRMEAAMAPLMRGGGRHEHPVVQPHRAALALAEAPPASPAAALGHDVIGPVLDAFVDWLETERQALAARTAGEVKLLFLMRDGLLPLRAFERRRGASPQAAAVHLSRFTAVAAGLRSAADVARFCGDKLSELEPELIARQLLLRPAEAVELAGPGPSARRRARFAAALAKPAVLNRVLGRTERFRERLLEHVRAAVDPRPGDTLMLVDLGYNGTVQNWIEPVLRDALGAHVAGRYLLYRPQEITGFDKSGMIDATLVDDGCLDSLTRYIAVLEQLCTAAEGSVTDYRDGAPVLRANDIKAGQSATRDAVQQGALAYVEARPDRPHPAAACGDGRLAAAAVLGRLLFFPTAAELEVLADFQHDVNLGSSQTHALFDARLGPEQLRERGPFFMNGARRMYLPAELAGAGLPLGLTVLASARFGLDLRHEDFHPDPVRLPILVAAPGGEVHEHQAPAYATHDGYLRCMIPVADRRFSVGLQFGRLYEWVQLDSLRFEPAAQATDFDLDAVSPVFTPADAVGQDVTSPAPGLLGLETEAAFILATPPPRTDDTPWVLTAVFRPLVPRVRAGADAATQAAAARKAA